MPNLSEIIENTIKLHNTKSSLKGINKIREKPEHKRTDFGKETLKILTATQEDLIKFFSDRGIVVDNTDVKAIYDSLDDEKEDD